MSGRRLPFQRSTVRPRASAALLPALSFLHAYYTYDNANVTGNTVFDISPNNTALITVNTPTSVVGSVAGQGRSFVAGSNQRSQYNAVGSHPWDLVWQMANTHLPWSLVLHFQGPATVNGNYVLMTEYLSTYFIIRIYTPAPPAAQGVYVGYSIGGNPGNFITWTGLTGNDLRVGYHDMIISSNGQRTPDGMKCYVDGVNVAADYADTIPEWINPHEGQAYGNYYVFGGTSNTLIRDEELWYTTAISPEEAAYIHQLRLQGIPLKVPYGL